MPLGFGSSWGDGMKRVKRRTDSGCVCEMVIYNAPDSADVRTYEKRIRFKDAEEYAIFKDQQGRRRFAQLINANYSPASLKGTLTFDTKNEVHDYDEARAVLRAYVRRIRRKCPDAKIVIVMGRAVKNSAKIHFHYIMDGVPEDVIRGKWTWGKIGECEHLWERVFYNGVDHGRDYTGLANYYWDHWTPEQGGHHYFATRNHDKPEAETPVEIRREYTPEKPPRAPKGYKLVEARATAFGFLYFKYTRIIS